MEEPNATPTNLHELYSELIIRRDCYDTDSPAWHEFNNQAAEILKLIKEQRDKLATVPRNKTIN